MAGITSVMRVQRIFQARIDEVLRPFELSLSRYELLMLLSFSRSGAMPLSKLGSRLQVHQTSVTNAVDRLEQEGLIKRTPHESDRRTTLAEILPKGRDLAAQATQALNESAFKDTGLDEGELTALFALLRKVRLQAGDFAET